MTAPGAGGGEGVSSIDVAASVSGIYEQMRQVGTQAAAGFSEAFNASAAQGVPPAGARSGSALGGAFTQALAAHFAGPLKGVVENIGDALKHGLQHRHPGQVTSTSVTTASKTSTI